jgi:hypothetical protein
MHENPIKARLVERWIVGFAAAALAGAFLNFEKVAATTLGYAWSTFWARLDLVPRSDVDANGTAQTFQLAPGNLSATNHFLDISANNGNVLLEQIAATAPTPEPSSLGLLLAGMLGLAGMSFQRRSTVQS